MRRRRIRLIIIVIGVLAGAALSVAVEVAAASMPSIVDRHRGFAWPLFFVLTVLDVGLAIWGYRYEADEDGPSVPVTSPADPFIISEDTTASQREYQNRSRMIQRVRSFWIEGVLQESLYHIARIELRLESRPAAVARPWDIVIQKSGRPPYQLPTGRPISQTFEEMNQAVLILGDPGSGKTTLLLELAEELLNEAEHDPTHGVPVVFNLSSWGVARKPLVEWMVDELQERYVVPISIGRMWIRSEQVIPLLDGLDEVVQEHRSKCVEAINDFRRDYGLLPIAVCSRIADYEALRSAEGVPAELRLEEAMFIQPLNRKEVDRYLKDAGRPLAGVRTALRDDATLWELLNTPLLLSIMALTYGNKTAAQVRDLGPPGMRRARLFTAYTHEMFERRGRGTRFSRRDSVHWLRWLGRALAEHSQTVLRLEWMQPDWLARTRQRRLIALGVPLLVGLIASILVGSIAVLLLKSIVPRPFGMLSAALLGITAGVACGAATYDRRIRPAEGLDWSWADIRDFLVGGALGGLDGGLNYGLLVGLIAGIVASTVGLPNFPAGLGSAAIALFAGLFLSLLVGLNVGLTTGLLEWLNVQRGTSETVPREDVPRATQNVLIGGRLRLSSWHLSTGQRLTLSLGSSTYALLGFALVWSLASL